MDVFAAVRSGRRVPGRPARGPGGGIGGRAFAPALLVCLAAAMPDPAAAQTSAEQSGATAAAAADAESSLDAAISLLDELDRRRITAAWDEQPLLRVVNELDVVHGVPVSADWESLDRLGVDRRTMVTLRADDVPALAVLQQLAVLIGDDFERATIESWGGRIVLTTDAIASLILVPAVYDVRDLLAAEARSEGGDAGERTGAGARADGQSDGDPSGDSDTEAVPAEDDPAGAADDADAPGAGGAPGAPGLPGVVNAPGVPANLGRPEPGPGERLIRMALEHAAPETWLRFGGQTARATERDGVLLVTASATTHRMLRTVLGALRQADPRGLSVEAAIVRVPAGLWEQLDRRYDPSQAVFARRLMNADGATVLWRTRSSVSIDGRLEITQPLTGPGAASASAGAIELRLSPSRRADDGTIRMAVELRWGDPAAPSRLATEVPMDAVGGAAALEIPGAGGETDEDLVLVILPRRF